MLTHRWPSPSITRPSRSFTMESQCECFLMAQITWDTFQSVGGDHLFWLSLWASSSSCADSCWTVQSRAQITEMQILKICQIYFWHSIFKHFSSCDDLVHPPEAAMWHADCHGSAAEVSRLARTVLKGNSQLLYTLKSVDRCHCINQIKNIYINPLVAPEGAVPHLSIKSEDFKFENGKKKTWKYQCVEWRVRKSEVTRWLWLQNNTAGSLMELLLGRLHCGQCRQALG